jgi:acetyl esterase/lipase
MFQNTVCWKFRNESRIMKKGLIVSLLFFAMPFCLMVKAQDVQSFMVIRLWTEKVPDAIGTGPNDVPTLTIYKPADHATGAAMVICPGGGYAILSAHEGHDYALWLNEMGITCFVLKYRLGSNGYHHPCMLNDAARALRTIRAGAAIYGIDPNRIGIMGSSAGGHLASTLITHFDEGNPDAEDPIERVSCRPNLGILCYPVITMGANTDNGSKKQLLGLNPSPELIKLLSNELHVSKNTPPCFIWHTWEDPVVKMENSLDFAVALQKQAVPYDLHIYQKGAHGLGLGAKLDQPQDFHPWTHDCRFWLIQQRFAK